MLPSPSLPWEAVCGPPSLGQVRNEAVFTELSKHISRVRQEMLNSMKEETACQTLSPHQPSTSLGFVQGLGRMPPTLVTSFVPVFWFILPFVRVLFRVDISLSVFTVPTVTGP